MTRWSIMYVKDNLMGLMTDSKVVFSAVRWQILKLELWLPPYRESAETSNRYVVSTLTGLHYCKCALFVVCKSLNKTFPANLNLTGLRMEDFPRIHCNQVNEINHNSISWINKFAALTVWLAQSLHGFAPCVRADPIQTQKWSWPPPKVTFMESRKERWRNKEPARRGLWLRRHRPRGSDKGHLVMSGGDIRTWAVCPRAGEEGAHGGGASLRSALQGSLMDRWGVCVWGSRRLTPTQFRHPVTSGVWCRSLSQSVGWISFYY